MATTVQAELKAILAGTSGAKVETERLDFKEQKQNLKEAWNDLAEAAVCFANGSGGVLIVGVSDKIAGKGAFVGTDLDPTVLRAKIHQLTNPSLLERVC